MSPEYPPEAWIQKAETDRRAAKRSLADAHHDPGQAEIACFHAQQCVEKYMKALLAKDGREVPRIHDLGRLAELLRPMRLPASKLQDDLSLLNQHAVAVRYPGSTATVPQAKRAVAAMERVVRACGTLLKKTAQKPG